MDERRIEMNIPTYKPLYRLKKVAENIWIVDGELIKMSVGIIDIPFSIRMTIIKLKDRSLWCHSPIKPNKKLFEEINKLGKVRHLVSPNKIHYAYIGEWKKYYPDALAWSSPGVKERARSQHIFIKFDCSLENNPPASWSEEIDQLIFKGSYVLEEVVFFHKSSQTLIVADLIENFEPKRTKSFLWKNIHKLAGISDPDGQTPIDYRISFFRQKEQARQCLSRMLKWNPKKIILAHGRWYDKDGIIELKRALRWLN